MKGTAIRKTFLHGCIVLIIISCGWLVADNPLTNKDPVNIVVPIDPYLVDPVPLDFEVRETGDYQFALLLNIGYGGNNPQEVQRRMEQVFGYYDNKGETIPVSLRLIKDGKLFLDEQIESGGTVRKHSVYLKDDGKRDTMVRNIKILSLSPGRYSAIITLLKNVPAFAKTSISAHVIHYTAENLARIKKQNQATERKWKNEWYQRWRFTKWLNNCSQ